jgi:single-strand DNA-binding protein
MQVLTKRKGNGFGGVQMKKTGGSKMYVKSNVSVEIIGRLGQDPDVKNVGDNKSVANLSVAVNEFYNKKEVTTWHQVVFWGASSELIERHLKCGDLVRIKANLSYKEIPDSIDRAAILTGTEFTVLAKAFSKEEGQ